MYNMHGLIPSLHSQFYSIITPHTCARGKVIGRVVVVVVVIVIVVVNTKIAKSQKIGA